MRKAIARILAVGLVVLTILAVAGPASAVTDTVRAARRNGVWKWLADQNNHEYIRRGDKVKWVNNTNAVHNVVALDTASDWDYSRTIPPDSSVTRRFRRVGDFKYDCTIHARMSGWVHVSAPN